MTEFGTSDCEHYQPLVGELLVSEPAKPKLFKLEQDGQTLFLPLSQVSGAGIDAEGIVYIQVGDLRGTIDDPADIERFWDQWEIV